MNFPKSLFVIFLAICHVFFSNAQEPTKIERPEMLEDLDFLHKKLVENHPNPFLYINRDSLVIVLEHLKEQVGETQNETGFYRIASQLATSLKDAHTSVYAPPSLDFNHYYDNGGLVFPMRLILNEQGFFVKENFSQSRQLKPGAKIISINGKATSKVLSDFRTIINDVHPLYDIYSNIFNELYWKLYGKRTEFQIKYLDDNKELKEVTATAIRKDEMSTKEETKPENFTFEILRDGHIGLLNLNSMFEPERFDVFLDSTFRVLRNKHIKDLIIDVRKNQGGRGKMVDSLMNYLTNEPYELYTAIKYKISQDLKDLYIGNDPYHTDPRDSTFILSQPNGKLADFLVENNMGPIIIEPHPKDLLFQGDTYVLSGNRTFSAGAMFVGVFKCAGLGTVIGSSPGQTTKFVADHANIVLPNSKLIVGISFIELHMPCEQSYYSGIQPHYEVSPKLEDLDRNVDTVMEFTIDLIKSKH